jgi:predicted translin family RNA/ssDNA-binding protein
LRSAPATANPDAPAAAQHYDAQRDAIIKRSRDMQKAAKTAVYCLQRGDLAAASRELLVVEKIVAELQPTLAGEPTLRYGSYAAAMEEYAEAAIFRHYLQAGCLLPSRELPLCVRDEYLGGLLDFTGELNRYAVLRATARDVASVTRCRDLVDAVFGAFLRFDLRNGALRKKFDALKYTLKKMESLLYEMQLASPVQSTRMDTDAAPPAAEAPADADGDAELQ